MKFFIFSLGVDFLSGWYNKRKESFLYEKNIFGLVVFLFAVCMSFSLSSCTNSSGSSGNTGSKNCEHTYVESEVERSDYGRGYTLHKCSNCSYSYETNVKLSYYDDAKEGLDCVIDNLKSKLKDPSFIQYDGVCTKTYSTNDNKPQLIEGVFMYKVHYNAKNSFGGYVGYQKVYYLWNGSNVKIIGVDYYTEHFLPFFTF